MGQRGRTWLTHGRCGSTWYNMVNLWYTWVNEVQHVQLRVDVG